MTRGSSVQVARRLQFWTADIQVLGGPSKRRWLRACFATILKLEVSQRSEGWHGGNLTHEERVCFLPARFQEHMTREG